MKIPGRVRGAGLKFNLTPMIDVVFNLIIFFLVASHYSRSEAVVDLELPRRKSTRAISKIDSQRAWPLMGPAKSKSAFALIGGFPTPALHRFFGSVRSWGSSGCVSPC